MMAEQKTPGAVWAAPEGKDWITRTRGRYTFPHWTVNPWHRAGAVADRVVARLPRPAS